MPETPYGHLNAGEPDEAHGAGHSASLGKYIAVFAALCVLTGASFFTYSDFWPFHDTPAVGWSFMMAVSCTKAALVMLFFMHLWWETNWKYVLTIPAMFMAVFLMCMLVPDIGMRTRKYSEERWEFAAEPGPEGLPLGTHEEGAHGEGAGHGEGTGHGDGAEPPSH